MQSKIMSLLLVLALLVSISPFVYAEGLDTEGLTQVEEQNIEENTNLIEKDDVDYIDEELDVNKEQIFDTTQQEQENSPSDSSPIEEDNQGVSGEIVEGSTEPSNPTEGTTPPDTENSVEGSTEPSEDNIDTGVVEDIQTGVIIEQPPLTEEELNAPTVIPAPDEEIDPGFTIPPEEEQQGQIDTSIIPESEIKEPQTFYVDAPLIFHGDGNGAMAACLSYGNLTGVDVILKGVEIIPLNGWSMVGEELDFKNCSVDTKQFRLTVNKQIIITDDNQGYIDLNNPVEISSENSIGLTLILEMGPLSDSIKEDVFSFRLVLEEIVDSPIVTPIEPVQPVQPEPVVPTEPSITPTEPEQQQPPKQEQPLEPEVIEPEITEPEQGQPPEQSEVLEPEPSTPPETVEPEITEPEPPTPEVLDPIDEVSKGCLPDTLPDESVSSPPTQVEDKQPEEIIAPAPTNEPGQTDNQSEGKDTPEDEIASEGNQASTEGIEEA